MSLLRFTGRRQTSTGVAGRDGTPPRSYQLAIGLTGLAVLVTLAILSLFLEERVYDQVLVGRLRPPFWESGGSTSNVLGTDSLGRDVLSRIMAGLRVSLQIGVASVLIGSVLGVALGVLSGYYGGKIDDAIMRLTDAVLAIPIVLLALSVIAVVGGGARNLILVIALTQWMAYARTARGEVMVLREVPFVTAAKSLGCLDWQIILRHCLPHVLPSVLVLATLGISEAVLLEAGLSFLGLGIQPPDPSLGSMLTEGRQYIHRAPWLAIYPGAVLLVLVLAINTVGDGLRRRIDRRAR
ncbi:MAG: ABC transporter permease [Nocardioidaceae bacterium]